MSWIKTEEGDGVVNLDNTISIEVRELEYECGVELTDPTHVLVVVTLDGEHFAIRGSSELCLTHLNSIAKKLHVVP